MHKVLRLNYENKDIPHFIPAQKAAAATGGVFKEWNAFLKSSGEIKEIIEPGKCFHIKIVLYLKAYLVDFYLDIANFL
jgi:hypothetical protein